MERRATQRRGAFKVGIVLGCLLAGPFAWADDVTTLSGRTLQGVRVARVEPDGVTWEHATGISKVDFTDLPVALRQQFHYDAARATAYQAAQTQAREQAAAQVREDQRKLTEGRTRHFQQQQASKVSDDESADAGSGTFVYRRERSRERAEEAVGEQIAARKLAYAKLTEYDGTLYDRRLWAIPQLLVGIHSDGHDFDPPDTDSEVYKRGLRRSPETRRYYEDVDRAEAFAKGRP